MSLVSPFGGPVVTGPVHAVVAGHAVVGGPGQGLAYAGIRRAATDSQVSNIPERLAGVLARAIMDLMASEGDVSGTVGQLPQAECALRGAPSLGVAVELVGDPTRDEVRLPNRPESAATARRLTEAVLRQGWAAPATTTEHAVLLVSELVGNAVRHTGAHTFGMRMHRRRGSFRIEVRDPSRGLPCLLPVTPLDVSGRGLWLIDHLADRWGVDLLPRGKSTWFDMRLPDPAR